MVDMLQLQLKAGEAWEEFRARYHALLNGARGSPASPGKNILPVRSGMQEVGKLTASLIESLNGSGELPDANLLYSCAASMGVSPAGFIVTLLSVMTGMDGMFSITNGEHASVCAIFEHFIGSAAPRTTAENTFSKTPMIPGSTQSAAVAGPSMPQDGTPSRRGRSSNRDDGTRNGNGIKRGRKHRSTKKASRNKRRK